MDDIERKLWCDVYVTQRRALMALESNDPEAALFGGPGVMSREDPVRVADQAVEFYRDARWRDSINCTCGHMRAHHPHGGACVCLHCRCGKYVARDRSAEEEASYARRQRPPPTSAPSEAIRDPIPRRLKWPGLW